MTDQPFREIQLSGKQLFFLFMASVVLAVAIFLLGVSVGRGVRSTLGENPTTTTGAASDTAVPVGDQPPTTPKPGELAYNERLQGQPSPAAPPAEPPPTTPAETAPVTAPAAPPVTPPVVAEPPAPSAAAKPAPATPQTQAPASAGTWLVQAGAFATRPAADGVAAMLRKKGFAAFVETQGPVATRFRVRVGPFLARAEAEATAARMKTEANTAGIVTQRD